LTTEIDDVHFEPWSKNVAVHIPWFYSDAIIQVWSITWKKCGAGKDFGRDSRVLHVGVVALSYDPILLHVQRFAGSNQTVLSLGNVSNWCHQSECINCNVFLT